MWRSLVSRGQQRRPWFLLGGGSNRAREGNRSVCNQSRLSRAYSSRAVEIDQIAGKSDRKTTHGLGSAVCHESLRATGHKNTRHSSLQTLVWSASKRKTEVYFWYISTNYQSQIL